MALHRCRICLEYSSETISVHDQVAVGVSYLDINLKSTNHLQLDGSKNELLHICVPCANMTKTAYNLKVPCEEADYKLEFNEEIFVEEKAGAVKTEDMNINFTYDIALSQCKNEDDFFSNCTDYSYLSLKEVNNVKLLNQTKIELVDENEHVTLSSSDIPLTVKLELDDENENKNVTLNSSEFSVREETNIVCKNKALEVYHCTLCEKIFKHRRNLRKHSKVVHKVEKIPCYYCDYVPESTKDYMQHAKAEHGDKRISCNYCDQTFFETQSLRIHLLRHNDSKNYVCDICGHRYILKNRLIAHLRWHEQKMRISCSECGKCFKKLSTLNKHLKSKECEANKNKVGHAAWTAYACKVCDKSFTQPSTLRRHNKVKHNLHETTCYFCDFLPGFPDELTNHIAHEHTDKKSWACKDCGNMFSELHILKTHLLIHTAMRKYICNVCGDTFNSKPKLNMHVKKHAEEKLLSCSDEDKFPVAQETLNRYVCKVCNNKYRLRSSLRRHMKSTHNVMETSCYYCEYVPETPSDLPKHTEKEHADKKTLACDQCDTSFFDVKDLDVHLLIHNGRTKNYECKLCNYKCSKKSYLSRHVRKHTGENPIQCPYCGKHYGLETHLANQSCNVPIKKVHEANPENNRRAIIKHTANGASTIYDCKVCGKKFIRRSDLRKHTKIIHKINDTSCFFCDYVPTSSNDLRKHSEKEHADKKMKTCEHCGKSFFDIRDLRRHLSVHKTCEKYTDVNTNSLRNPI